MKNRQEKQIGAITNDGFEYKGVKYKTLTTRMLLLMEKFKSDFYTGGDQLRGLMDYLFLASADLKTVQNYTVEQFEEAVYDFADNFTSEDLGLLSEIVNESVSESSSTMVEIKEDSSTKKPQKA